MKVKREGGSAGPRAAGGGGSQQRRGLLLPQRAREFQGRGEGRPDIRVSVCLEGAWSILRAVTRPLPSQVKKKLSSPTRLVEAVRHHAAQEGEDGGAPRPGVDDAASIANGGVPERGEREPSVNLVCFHGEGRYPRRHSPARRRQVLLYRKLLHRLEVRPAPYLELRHFSAARCRRGGGVYYTPGRKDLQSPLSWPARRWTAGKERLLRVRRTGGDAAACASGNDDVCQCTSEFFLRR